MQVTALSDYVLYYYPGRYFQAKSFRAGHLNLWNPSVFGGHPAFASSAGLVAFDPFNLLLYWPDLGSALAWRSFLQVVGCMLFMYLYIRHLTLGTAAALIASIGYGLNSMFWVNVFDWSIGGMLWLPLICLLIDRAVTQPSSRNTALAGLVFGMALLASPLQIYLYLCVAIGGLLGLQWLVLWRDWRSLKIFAVIGTTVVIIGVGLSAVQIISSAELLGQSARFAGGPLQATSRPPSRSPSQMAMATAGLTSFVFPNIAGRQKGSMSVAGALWGAEAHWQGFIGVLPFFLAVFGVLAGTDRRRVPYAIFALAILVLVLYTPVGAVLYDRSFLLYIFCASVLAAFGYDAIARGQIAPDAARFSLRLLAGFLIAVLICQAAFSIALLFARPRITSLVDAKVLGSLSASYLGPSYPALYLHKAHTLIQELSLFSPHTIIPATFAAAGLTLIALGIRGRIGGPAFAGIAVTLTAVDLVFMTLTHVPLVDAQRNPFAPSSAALDVIKRDTGVFRVISYQSLSEAPVLPLGIASIYDLQAADGYDDLGPPNLARLISFAKAPCGLERCLVPRGLDVANVKYVVSGPRVRLPADRFDLIYDHEVRVHENRRVLERAFWVSSYAVVPNTESAIALAGSPDFDPLASVIVDQEPDPAPDRSMAPAAVVVRDYAASRLTLQIDAASAGLVVVSDTFYPGWRAVVDDREVPILRANGVMRAVAVGPGRHNLSFVYQPKSLRRGVVVSSLSLLVALTLAVSGRGSAGR